MVRSEHFFRAIEHCVGMDDDFRERILKLREYRVLRDEFYKHYVEAFTNQKE